ncbi:MAG: LPXTG cell wall anchor domain-containing protein [Bryobacteraceae bacterium]
MTNTIRRILTELCMAVVPFTILSAIAIAQQMPKQTKEEIKGASTVTTQEASGTVVAVEGNQLVVRMSTGGLRTFNVPESRKFIVDGKELTVHDLQPGTQLTATVTTTKTPVTDRITTIGSGKVWFVSGNTVIVTLPNGENKMYHVKDSYRFDVNGQKASVHDLRKGMTVSAEKIVEEPRTEIASNTEVTGHAPPPPAPKPVVAQAPAPAPAKEEAAPAPAPAPAEVAEAKQPAELPKTGSELPLAGVLGLLLTGSAFYIRKLRRS